MRRLGHSPRGHLAYDLFNDSVLLVAFALFFNLLPEVLGPATAASLVFVVDDSRHLWGGAVLIVGLCGAVCSAVSRRDQGRRWLLVGYAAVVATSTLFAGSYALAGAFLHAPPQSFGFAFVYGSIVSHLIRAVLRSRAQIEGDDNP